ncbi:rhodanese-like domain-containing protein [Maribacter ulvicola]|uniref:Rhodanese-related sulfurtransferase n=1 Tax=Maribacter ulvicola TaxID=228959 RepID=A0A1N6RAP6_9FLAO|nr:rhodanese-like domain-containing protein [Maribacter ulvicola]SIQ25877.1 Rhodanese-related sulfurtransferase [Maribacter ulvicola]
MRILLVVLLLISVQFTIGQIVSRPITEFTGFNEFTEVLLDVRTSVEFKAGCIDGAVNIDWLSNQFNERVRYLDKNKKIYVYCKKGGRSIKSQKRLAELGFKNVVNLEGGYDAFLMK